MLLAICEQYCGYYLQ